MRSSKLEGLGAKKGAIIGLGAAIITTGIVAYQEPEFAQHLPETLFTLSAAFVTGSAAMGYLDEKVISPFQNYVNKKIFPSYCDF